MINKIGTFKDYNDGTLKTVFDVGANKIIEMSLLFNKKDKDVVCVPTHHFCNLGCKMCHLTNRGFNKEMAPVKWKEFVYCLLIHYLLMIREELIKRTYLFPLWE